MGYNSRNETLQDHHDDIGCQALDRRKRAWKYLKRLVFRDDGLRAGSIRVEEAGNDGMATAPSTRFQGEGMQNMKGYYRLAMV